MKNENRFWLRHANIDRLWGQWHKTHAGPAPGNLPDTLQPKPIFGVTVASVQDIEALGYRYV